MDPMNKVYPVPLHKKYKLLYFEKKYTNNDKQYTYQAYTTGTNERKTKVNIKKYKYAIKKKNINERRRKI